MSTMRLTFLTEYSNFSLRLFHFVTKLIEHQAIWQLLLLSQFQVGFNDKKNCILEKRQKNWTSLSPIQDIYIYIYIYIWSKGVGVSHMHA